MVTPVVVLLLLALLVVEATVLWIGQIRRARAEAAYWAARDAAPDLYDWAKDPGQ